VLERSHTGGGEVLNLIDIDDASEFYMDEIRHRRIA
jgi:hypothetical protein